MQGKRILITGGNSGIGKVAACELARMGAEIIIAGRASEKTERALKDIRDKSGSDRVTAMTLDLASLQSVRNFTDEFKSKYDSLHVLVNNAGIFPTKKRMTTDGFEMQFGVNHLAHFLLTLRLLDLLKASCPARVVTVSSMMHKNASIDFDSFTGDAKYNSQKAYGQSKLANVLFARELADRLDGSSVTSNSLHPGGVKTDIMRDLPWVLRIIVGWIFVSPEKGAQTTIKLASDESLEEVSGHYYDQERLAKASPLAKDKALRSRLWQTSEQLTGVSTIEA